MKNSKTSFYFKLTLIICGSMTLLMALMHWSVVGLQQEIINNKKMRGEQQKLIHTLIEDFDKMNSSLGSSLIYTIAPVALSLLVFAFFIKKFNLTFSFWMSFALGAVLYQLIFQSILSFDLIYFSMLIGTFFFVLSFVQIAKNNPKYSLLAYFIGLFVFIYLPVFHAQNFFSTIFVELIKLLTLIASLFVFHYFVKTESTVLNMTKKRHID